MIRLLLKDIIYAGLTVGPCLTLLEILKKASDIKLFAFSSGSFFIIQLLQFNKVINVNYENLENFLLHSVIGGISWVFVSLIMYILHKLKYSKEQIMISTISLVLLQALCSVIYYKIIQN
tara:strand:+ start:1818 stop:2177 length:360 start_codon:yes stop_codon:yes gene_type:complete